MSKIRVEIRVKPCADNTIEVDGDLLKVGSKQFKFSRVHCDSSQETFFETVLPLLEKFYNNNDCTVFAYGQTGSGKTYTMGISEHGTDGVLQRSLGHIFAHYAADASSRAADGAETHGTAQHAACARPRIRIAFYEIYNEEVFDLLSPVRSPLPLRESSGVVTIAGLKEHVVERLEDALVLLHQGCLERTTKATAMNLSSSRSHAVFTVFVNQARISFIDLAGSERLKRTKLTGRTVRESININSGLLALGNVINALSAKRSYVPFRDSKLTRILQSSLKDNFTFMIVCISGKCIDFNETMNALEYANRAANITTYVKNKVLVDTSGVLYLKEEISRLRGENQVLRNQLKEKCRCKERNKEHEAEVNALRMRVYELESLLSRSAAPACSPGGSRKSCSEEKENRADNASCPGRSPEKREVLAEDTQCAGAEEGEAVSSARRNASEIDAEALNRALVVDDGVAKAAPKRVTFNMVENVILLTPKKQKKLLFTPGRDNIKLRCSVRATYRGHENAVTSLVCTDRLHSSSLDKTIREWPSGNVVHRDLFVVRSMVAWRSLLFSSSGAVKRLDAREGASALQLDASPGVVSSMFCEGDILYVGTEDGCVAAVDLRMMRVAMKKQMHKGTVFCITRVGEHIYTGSRDHEIKRFAREAAVSLSEAAPCGDGVLGAAGSPRAGAVTRSPGVTTLPTAHYDSVHVLLSMDDLLVSGGRDCSIKIWRDLRVWKTVPYAHPSWIKSGTPAGAFYATGSKCGLVKFWDCKEKVTCIGRAELRTSVNALVCDGQHVYAGLQDRSIAVIEGRYE